MGEAAKISLNAIGKQDTHLLSKDPEESFFNYEAPPKHSEFRKYHRSHQVVNKGQIAGWPFGETVKVQFNPTNMGDLLSNMWLSITMPALSSGENYADQLGRHILKSVTMFVDELEIEKLHDDWGIIYDELYLEMSEKVANRFLVNRNIGYDQTPDVANPVIAQSKADIVIPLHFFFSRKYASDEYSSNKPNRPYFPLCSAYKQKLTFELEFHKESFFSNTTQNLEISSFDIITEEITVSVEEKNFLLKERQTLITDLVRKHPSTISVIGENTIKTNLVPNIPVKCLHWFLRNTSFEDENVSTDAWGFNASNAETYAYQNRFNFSSNAAFIHQESIFNPIMESTSLSIDGFKLPNLLDTGHIYYKYLVPSRNRLARPYRNIYTYSFSMNPINVEPSGNFDFSEIKSDKTSIEVKLDTTPINPVYRQAVDVSSNTYSLNMYYTGYQTFTFEKGFMSIAY